MSASVGAIARRAWLVRHHRGFVVALSGSGLAVAAALILLFGDPLGVFADRMLSNARPPLDRELPQTAGAVSYQSTDTQVIGGQGKELSCSIPGLVEFLAFPRAGRLASISLQMRQACVFHDYCYRHGAATYGYTQADCDYLLLEHAYRICRFINTDAGVGACTRRARKVLLGVRIGGSDSFKRADGIPASIDPTSPTRCGLEDTKDPAPKDGRIDEACTSSYFEFDPYPVRSNRFTVYRIADAPTQWTDVVRKALYVFEVRPSATRVTVLAWSKGAGQTYCTGYELPGGFEFLSVAPHVARTGGTGGEDWLIWWRRRDLESTGGYLAILAPGRATLDDWARLFRGARPITPQNCTERTLSPAKPSVAQASRKILIGDSRQKKLVLGEKDDDPIRKENDDPNISELHAAPGLEPDGKIRLIALRTHTCQNQDTRVPMPTKGDPKRTQVLNTLCHHDIKVAPDGDRIQSPEPYVARDEINRRIDGKGPRVERRVSKDGLDPDRYRNFVTPPIALGGDRPGPPVVAWLRRGERLGETYRDQALLRRASHTEASKAKDEFGTGLPIVLLKQFDEAADPAFVLGRAAETPKLMSLRLNSDPKQPTQVLMHWWKIPRSGNTDVKDDCKRPQSDPLRSLNACAQHEEERNLVDQKCLAALDDSWLVRPPIVLASPNGGADIVFSKLNRSGQPGLAWLDITRLHLANSAECTPGKPHAYPVGVAIGDGPPTTSLPNEDASPRMDRWRKTASAALTDLRARPVLVADVGDERYVIVPDAKNLARTAIVALR
jgi:hypothetical protein